MKNHITESTRKRVGSRQCIPVDIRHVEVTNYDKIFACRQSPQKCCDFHAMGIVTVWGKINTTKKKGRREIFSSTRHTSGGA